MTQDFSIESSKLIIDLLVAYERLQFAQKTNKSDITDSFYLLYSTTIKMINKIVNVEMRKCRLFRLKYHHILSNESVEEYLFHCLSKILSDVLDEENSYQRFIQPVVELHMKLISIISQIHLQHYEVVRANRKVRQEMDKDGSGSKVISNNEYNDNEETQFQPVYYLPSTQMTSKKKRAQLLTFQSINKYYNDHDIDPLLTEMLLDFDNSFADFELDFVCQVNKTNIISSECAEKTMDVAIMFAEAVRWAHWKGLLHYSSISDCDIEIMVGIPRLSVLYGCAITKHGPLSEGILLSCYNQDKAHSILAPVFQDQYKELARLRRQLNALNTFEMMYLSHLLVDQSDLPDSPTHIKLDDCSYLISGDVHAIFKLIASVSDQMQSEHASDYRFFMEVIYKLYKDESDDLVCSSFIFPKSISTPDLFKENLYVSCINEVDEAVEALSFVILDKSSSDKSSKSLLDIKSCHSSLPSNVSKQPQTDTINNSVQNLIDLNARFKRPSWQEDSSYSKCCHCGVRFHPFRRRHHCRRCGYLFCYSCWGTKITLPSMGIYSEVPVCVECEEFIQGKENENVAANITS